MVLYLPEDGRKLQQDLLIHMYIYENTSQPIEIMHRNRVEEIAQNARGLSFMRDREEVVRTGKHVQCGNDLVDVVILTDVKGYLNLYLINYRETRVQHRYDQLRRSCTFFGDLFHIEPRLLQAWGEQPIHFKTVYPPKTRYEKGRDSLA